MAMAPQDLMGFAVFASMRKAERSRAQSPLMMTLLPGAPAQRAALATVAVGIQAKDAVRRETQVVAATLAVVTERARKRTPLAEAIGHQPALRDLATDGLFEGFEKGFEDGDDAREEPAEENPGVGRVVLEQAGDMVVAALQKTSKRTFSEEEAREFAEFLSVLPRELQDKIVKNP